MMRASAVRPKDSLHTPEAQDSRAHIKSHLPGRHMPDTIACPPFAAESDPVQDRSDPTEGPHLVAVVDDVLPSNGDSACAQLLCTLMEHNTWYCLPARPWWMTSSCPAVLMGVCATPCGGQQEQQAPERYWTARGL